MAAGRVMLSAALWGHVYYESADFGYYGYPDWYVHPATGVMILAEDMPAELLPCED